MDESLLRAIRILALFYAENPDYDFMYRRICRWYSREFSTPLETAYKLSDETVLQTYFEDLYDKLHSEALQTPAQVEETESDDGLPAQHQIIDTQFAAEKRSLLGDLVVGTQTLEAIREQEDDQWEKEMLEEIRRDEEAAQAKKKPKSSKADQISPLLEKPNLLDQEIKKTVQGESDPIFEED